MRLPEDSRTGERQGLDEGRARKTVRVARGDHPRDGLPASRRVVHLVSSEIIAEVRRRLAAKGFAWGDVASMGRGPSPAGREEEP
jgi:hypothetical protein